MRQLLIIGAWLLTHAVMAQFTLTGLKGLIHVPTAEVIEEATFLLGTQTNTKHYFLVDYGVNRQEGSEYVTAASIGFYKRLSVTMTLSRIYGDPKQQVGEKSSIGDRSVQLNYLILKESKFLPALAVNISDPFYSSNQFLAANHLVATKYWTISETQQMSSTLGYGLPYVLSFSGQEKRELLRKRSDWLKGVFGGLQYTYQPLDLVASVEYDGWHVNAAVGKIFWDRLSLKAFMQGLQYPGVSLHYQGKIR